MQLGPDRVASACRPANDLALTRRLRQRRCCYAAWAPITGLCSTGQAGGGTAGAIRPQLWWPCAPAEGVRPVLWMSFAHASPYLCTAASAALSLRRIIPAAARADVRRGRDRVYRFAGRQIAPACGGPHDAACSLESYVVPESGLLASCGTKSEGGAMLRRATVSPRWTSSCGRHRLCGRRSFRTPLCRPRLPRTASSVT